MQLEATIGDILVIVMALKNCTIIKPTLRSISIWQETLNTPILSLNITVNTALPLQEQIHVPRNPYQTTGLVTSGTSIFLLL